MLKTYFKAFISIVAALATSLVHAQDYPTKPIQMIVPFSAGGTADVLGRQVAQRMGEVLGQTVVVENRGGAGSTLGSAIVANATPDGYTLLFATSSLAISASLYPKLPYDPARDFRSIGKVATTYMVLVTPSSFPASNFREFIDALKATPGKYNFGTAGVGSNPHLAAALMHSRSGLHNIVHVPYRGNAQVISALIAGDLSYSFLGMDSAIPHIKSGKLKAIAVTSPERDRALPDVPTIVESGIPDFDIGVWFALLAPASTPTPIVHTLNAALNKALLSPQFAEMTAKSAGFVLMSPSTPEQTDTYVRQEIKRWAPIVKSSGANPD